MTAPIPDKVCTSCYGYGYRVQHAPGWSFCAEAALAFNIAGRKVKCTVCEEAQAAIDAAFSLSRNLALSTAGAKCGPGPVHSSKPALSKGKAGQKDEAQSKDSPDDHHP